MSVISILPVVIYILPLLFKIFIPVPYPVETEGYNEPAFALRTLAETLETSRNSALEQKRELKIQKDGFFITIHDNKEKSDIDIELKY